MYVKAQLEIGITVNDEYTDEMHTIGKRVVPVQEFSKVHNARKFAFADPENCTTDWGPFAVSWHEIISRTPERM